jgi:hypothetical protein
VKLVPQVKGVLQEKQELREKLVLQVKGVLVEQLDHQEKQEPRV